MRIAIYGAGGAGGYFGTRLAQTGEEVIFIARGTHLDAMRKHGLRIDSISGDFIVPPVQATDDPAQVGTVDMVLLGVKAWQVVEVAQALKPMVGAETVVVPLQNGVEAATQVADVLGAGHVVGGLAKIISLKVGDGHIRHAGAEPFIAIGELDNRPSQRTQRIRQVFEQSGVAVDLPANIQAALIVASETTIKWKRICSDFKRL
jgi:2-dehydropantoate 2-reductase